MQKELIVDEKGFEQLPNLVFFSLNFKTFKFSNLNTPFQLAQKLFQHHLMTNGPIVVTYKNHHFLKSIVFGYGCMFF
jgi:hypothetical protein